MKKKTHVKKTAPKKTTTRTRSHASDQIMLLPFSYRRIVLITSAIALFFVAVVVLNRQPLTQSVAGVSVARGLFGQATIQLPQTTGAVAYNIYYKQTSEKGYTNAVRNVSPSTATYTISYLKKGQNYQYKVSALNAAGREFWWSDTQTLTNIQPM